MKKYIVTEEILNNFIKNNFKEGSLTRVLRDWLKTLDHLDIDKAHTIVSSSFLPKKNKKGINLTEEK